MILSGCLIRASRRFLLRNPWNLWLSVLGIGLGVAVVVAVELANSSARTAFRLSMEAVAGRATHQILGGPSGIPEQDYVALRLSGGPWASAPLVEGSLRLGNEPYTVLGVDPLAERPFRANLPQPGTGDLTPLLTEADTVLLPTQAATRLGLAVGGHLDLETRQGPRRVRVVGLFANDNPAAQEGLLVADLATAQELLGREGWLDRIDLILEPSQVADLEARLPPGLRLERASGRGEASLRLTESFQINLLAMSLLALLVGAFIIYNTMTFSVLQRRGLFGHLRVLGVTRRELFLLILAEALVVGLVGTLLGLLAGTLIAQGLVRLVTRTINDLYFTLTVTRLFVSPEVLARGALLGLAATLLATLPPAWEAARSEPRDVQRRTLVETRLGRLFPILALTGLALMGLGGFLALRPGQGLIVAFAALFMVILGFSLTVPHLLTWLCQALDPLADRLAPPLGRLALRGVARGLSRTGPAVAALTVAVSASVGMGIMIESFRATLALWLGQTLSSDIYVSSPSGMSNRSFGTLDPQVLPRLKQVPGIRDISAGRAATLETEHGPVSVLALRPGQHSYTGFKFKGATLPDLWTGFGVGELVLVSEPFAYRHGIGVGDSLRLFSPQGWQRFRVGAVIYHYSSERGLLVLHQARYAQLWNDPELSSVGIGLLDPASRDATIQAVRAALGPLAQALRIRPGDEVREQSLEVFDRTFAVTRVLRLLAVGVAFIGILSALLALYLEQAKTHAVLRATGATPRQLLGLVTLQSALLGLTAGLLALPLGGLIAQLLIQVINVRSFGWTMQTELPLELIGESLALAVGAALLAGLYPAWRIARTPPAEALREE